MIERAESFPGVTNALVQADAWSPNRAPLLLQSNPFMRSILVSLLRDAGRNDVHVARCADSAVEMMSERLPGVLVSDWNDASTPAEDRLRLIRRIRDMNDAVLREMPVIMISQPRPRQEIERARDAGVSEFIITPVAPNTIQHRLTSVREKPRDFIQSPRFTGPDRRRRKRHAAGPSYKRMADVEAGLTTPMQAARAAAVSLVQEMQLTGDPLAIRVARSLQRFIAHIKAYTLVEEEVATMHRAAISQLSRMAEDGNPLREPVVTGLEQVVEKRMRRG
ncbi:MAG: response regulator [Alphaproteobacteria bacterium]|uniref:response regulator n=1 Tax=Maricaulis alexandrii TaxID=2570354 RepID=UPI0011093BB4|nr:response regulator [Maricaulis alexandrii]MCR9266946.1 response regulator [Alphaproteobacteria bacterium]